MANQFPYPVTRAFGIQDPAYANYPDSRHPGTDYGTGNNTPLKAKMAGKATVYNRGNTATGRGNEVVITHGSTQIKYCHLNRVDVKNGATITAGQTIGLSGWTGYVLPKSPEGAHLHFEVMIDGKYVNPETWKGVEMITQNQLGVLYRMYLGRPVDSSGVKTFVGKKTFDQTQKAIIASAEYKGVVARSKAGTLKAQLHLPSAARNAYKAPTPPPVEQYEPVTETLYRKK